MKKIVAVIAFLVLSMSSVFSQNELRFGFQLSPTFSWMSTDDNTVNKNGTSLGLKLGLISEYYFRENYAFITGIGFAFNQGGTLLHENGGEIWTRSELPVNRDLPNGTNQPHQAVHWPLFRMVKLFINGDMAWPIWSTTYPFPQKQSFI